MQRVQNLPPDTIWVTTDDPEESRRTWDKSGASYLGVYGPHAWRVYIFERHMFCIVPESDKAKIHLEAAAR